MKHADYKNILKGVSTLDVMKKNYKATLLLVILIVVILTVFSANVFGGHSTLDLVDPTFAPTVQTNSYGSKWVNEIYALPDGKILALGSFNTYNRVPVGKLVRLNPDGSLDTTFNNQTVTAIDAPGGGRIFIQPDRKIVIHAVGLVAGGQGPKLLMRLNADGTFDSTFNFTQTGSSIPVMDSLGRVLLRGSFTTPNGTRLIVRLNDDGSIDNSFNFAPAAGAAVQNIAVQGNKLIVIMSIGNNRQIYRVNEDGSTDASFTPFPGTGLALSTVQPDNKILYQQNTTLFRLNEDGSPDNTLQSINLPQVVDSSLLKLTGDGKIVVTTSSNSAIFRRFLPNGTVDPAFSPYTIGGWFASYTIQSDDSIVIGDGIPFTPSSANNFVRLTPGGTVDSTFNPGGTGFQNVLPGVIQTIETYPNGKILLGGKFDVINNVPRTRLARLNADSTVDTTFQLNTTSGSGNSFSIIREVYQVRVQADGKIIVSGWFDYVLGGVTKINLVRLNSDGSIDPTFDLNYRIFDYSQINLGGQNRFAIYSDGKLMVGTSKAAPSELHGPIRLTAGGARDTSFNSTLNNTQATVYIHDVALQPDGKVLVSGQYPISSNSSKSFLGRLNSDGSLDSTFFYTEETSLLKTRLVLLPSSKILIIKSSHPNGGSAKLQRLNYDGSLDSSFNSVSLSDTTAKLNALLSLPNGKIFVGGRFTVTVNGQPGKNLLQLEEDGTFEPTVYNLNEEVSALAADSEGRVLVGGGFTVIGTGGGAGATRSYVARLTDSRARFDYDGDGKSDISVFRPSENKWYILQSSNGAVVQTIFAVAGDIPTPADFDGDGKTDVAIFRPSLGDWWYLSSINNAQVNVHWGQTGDIPRPSDFDGDGKTDFVVYRPSNSVWYRFGSMGATSIIEFGIAEDKPLVGDFDGDGKSDPAVFRPSTGDWWYASSASGGQFSVVHWGQSGDIPAPGDYDADGKTDFVVYRPSNGGWYILRSGEQNYTILQFGTEEDKPVAADYDGDGKTDVAVWRPSTGTWYLLQTTAGFGAVQWGMAGDMPTENAFLP